MNKFPYRLWKITLQVIVTVSHLVICTILSFIIVHTSDGSITIYYDPMYARC